MVFTFPPLLETFYLIYPSTAYFSQSCIQPISVLPFDHLQLRPHCLRHLLHATAEDTATNGAGLLMPALLGTCSPPSSEHQPCPNCAALDLHPLCWLHNTPVAQRIDANPLIAFQNWIAVHRARSGQGHCLDVWHMRGTGFSEAGLDGYTGQAV